MRNAIISKTVYAKMIPCTYNSPMRTLVRIASLLLISAIVMPGQTSRISPRSAILARELRPASLWTPYDLSLEEKRGSTRWRLIAGFLPEGMTLQELGSLTGTPQQFGKFEFAVSVRDLGNPDIPKKEQFALEVKIPLLANWDRRAQVNGQRIEGSVKVSNQTGRDFDLTFIVLAVNDIGRATAIGYQHFPLKKGTGNLPLPFGDTLSPGDYVVNVDVVGEEPISNKIFRARLVAEKQSIAQSP